MLIDDASHSEDFADETPCLRLLQHRGRPPGLSLDSLTHRILLMIDGASHLEDFFSTEVVDPGCLWILCGYHNLTES